MSAQTPIPIADPDYAPLSILADESKFNAPADEAFTGGLWRHRESGELYALAIHEPDNYFRTHSLKNTARFWEGDEREFRENFDPAR